MKDYDVEFLFHQHQEFWDKQRAELERYKNVYECRFWEEGAYGMLYGGNDNQMAVQTAEGYGYIESYIASLFAKNPAVVLKKGLKNKGDTFKAQEIANNFLLKCRHEIENCARLALIYPMSFIKLVPQSEGDIYNRVIPVSVSPWDIILDRDAPRFDKQRFIGHKYQMPIQEAKEKFGAKKFIAENKENYFKVGYGIDDDYDETPFAGDKSEYNQYVTIIEMYDLINDELIFYCPHIQRENKILERTSFIPFRDSSGGPVVPIVSLYFNRIPSQPLLGYSAMKRVYDQLFEINTIRSFMANSVRKASRQYLVKAGVLDEESMAQLTSGIDGLFVETEEEDLDGAIRAIPHNPMPTELNVYHNEVKQDLNQGSILAPFTRGDSTGGRTTASEITALAAYSSSELGRLARERDAMIEEMALKYLSITSTLMEGENPQVLNIGVETFIVTAEDLRGDFEAFASDQASTPLSETVAKRQLLENLPTLINLGVPREKLLKEVVRMLNLPEDFAEIPPQAEEATGRVSGIETPPTLGEAMANPMPENIQAFLPKDKLAGEN
jgi:hypothetical protein